MATPTLGSMLGFQNVTEVISANGQTDVITEVTRLRSALVPTSGISPDFDQIPPHMAEKLIVEIDALIAAIDAAPTA